MFAIRTELGIPIKLVGIGETIDDLIAFDPDEFVEASSNIDPVGVFTFRSGARQFADQA